MIKKLLYKIFGTRNDRLIKHYKQIVSKINLLETSISALSDDGLKQKTVEFKSRYNNGQSLDSMLPEVFAVCREASKRVLNMRHFDVQLIGGMVLHNGKIAEMRTGEGKTLVATLAVYLNAISGKGVHVVTVNDYLAKRDALDMGKLYNFLGLSVGINLSDMSHEAKKDAYNCDITYGTNNEFGFDYLRDNMVFDLGDKVQRELNFAVVDEVDSILIDEARTPLIISGPASDSTDIYMKVNKIPPLLTKQLEEGGDGHFWVDEKNKNIILSESGHEEVEKIALNLNLLNIGDSLYNVQNIGLMHHILAALKAHYLYFKDQHYVLENSEVVIVDEFTGRLMNGRRWSDGLHQAVEAKENLTIQRENQTLATITFQNYFRMYKKLSGMTGTADTEAYEFQQIYGLETVVIPTNKPMIRQDNNDKIYMNLQDKYNAIIDDVQDCNKHGQPVLIGTTSVENSEVLSALLTKAKIKHEVLNAKNHAREADIIAQAGSIGAVTVATNMAGRGTDIILGGNYKVMVNKINADATLKDDDRDDKIKHVMTDWMHKNKQVLDVGGLYIIGTERHESRRIDNQLRGRAGRQGDPGKSRFYLSLDDPLLRIFGGEKMRFLMQRLGMKVGESIEHRMLSRSIETAQRKVEAHNFDIRKQLLDYDNVSNDQRRVIYQQRDDILISADLSQIITNMITGVIKQLFDDYFPPKSLPDMWDIDGLERLLRDEYGVNYSIKNKLKDDPNISEQKLCDDMISVVHVHYNDKVQNLLSQFAGEDPSLAQSHKTKFERSILLQCIDHYWREHLTQLDQLREGIHLRGYAQKDPKQEYKHESFALFASMLYNIKNDVVKTLLTVNIQVMPEDSKLDDVDADAVGNTNTIENSMQISRNSPCPCGSGKKYKYCHGKL